VEGLVPVKAGGTEQRAPEVDLPPAGRRRLHVFCSRTLRFSLRKVLHAAVRENAFASSPATTLDLFLIENRRVPFPGPATLLHPQRPALPLAKSRRSSQTNPLHISGPAKLARLLPARAATRNVYNHHDEIKHFLRLAQ